MQWSKEERSCMLFDFPNAHLYRLLAKLTEIAQNLASNAIDTPAEVTMLLSFSVQNYYSIMERQTLSMVATALDGCHEPVERRVAGAERGVLPCALIYGANASGKSNLLQALMQLKSMVMRSNADAQRGRKLRYAPFRLHKGTVDAPTRFECIFEVEGVRYDYFFDYDSERISYEELYSYPEGRRRKLFVRDGLEVAFGAGMKGTKKAFTSFLKETSLLLSVIIQSDEGGLDGVKEFFSDFFGSNLIHVETPQIDLSFSSGTVDPRAIRFLEMIGTGVCDFKIEETDVPEKRKKWMREIINVVAASDEVSVPDGDFEIPDKEHKVKLGHRSANNELIYFGVDLESAGTRRLLMLLGDLFKALDKGCVAVVDEIDASLHTNAVRAIVELFTDFSVNRCGAQLIATTHDTNLLDTRVLRRDEIWFAEKFDFGASEYFSLADIKRRKDEVFERAYLDGRYGALPHSINFSELFG